MARVVMKFGGTSVADPERIKRVARIVAAERKPGLGVAVVVSAMAGETDRLVKLARETAGELASQAGSGQAGFDDEYDVVVSTGEQVTTGLLALALRAMGVPARSWQSWQVPMRSDMTYARARFDDIDPSLLGASMDRGEVAVIPGFQAINAENRITTPGRGGSDTSAVAVAAAIGAERCDIYTDVDGVYTTDPRMLRFGDSEGLTPGDPRMRHKARRLEKISYEEMLEMASLGSKVLQTRSVELAMAKRVPVRVLSSFIEPGQPNPGTLVCGEEEIVEKQIVSGVAYSRDEAKVTLLGVEDHPGIAAEIFGRLADANVNVDMIVQSQAKAPGAQNIVFTCPDRDAPRAVETIKGGAKLAFDDLQVRRDVAKVSVIGIGMKSQAGVARTMFAALAQKGINIEAIATSEIKISVLIDAQYTELAVRALHTAYGLDAA